MNSKFHSIKSLIKQYRWNSIFFKYLKKIFLFSCIPFSLVCIIAYAIFVHYIDNDLKNMIDISLQKTQSATVQCFDSANQKFLDLLLSQEITAFLSEDNLENSVKTQKNVSYFTNQCGNIMYNFQYIKNIILYSSLNEYVISPVFSGQTELFLKESWMKACQNNKGKPVFMASSSDNSFYLCYEMKIKSKNMGFLVFEITPDLFNSFASTDTIASENIVMIDNDGNIFYSRFDSTQALPSDFIQNALGSNSYFEKYSNTFLFSKKLENPECIIVSVNDYDNIAQSTKIFRIIFVLFVCLLIAILFVISIYLSSHVYNSIAQITSLLQEYSPDVLDNSDEIYYITNQILHLIKNTKNIEETLIKQINQLKKSQFVALQTQITPHFVYNTLNLVNAIIMNIVKGPNDAEKVIGILSDSFYYSLGTKNYLVNIEDEINYTKKFVEIEHIKLEGNFDISYDMSPDIYQYKAIKFMLQPIVENCFEHSIPYLDDRRGVIKIKIYTKHNALICSVFDNGNKIDENKLSKINTQLKSNDIPENKHIGLRNINSRIRLLFGDKYGCSIVSDDSGTTVTVKIPLIN